MKRTTFDTYSLYPAVILWGILIGAIVYSHTVFLPVYLSDLPNSAGVVTGKYALNEAPFWTNLHPLLILSLIVTMAANWKIPARRRLIVISVGIYSTVLIVTAVYFVPELLAFAKSLESNLPASEWRERGHRWQYLSLIRGAFCLIGFVPLLIALSQSADASKKSDALV